MNSYIFINKVEIYNFKAKDSEVNAAASCLGNASKGFSADYMKKDWMSMIFQLIMIVLMFIMFWVFIHI